MFMQVTGMTYKSLTQHVHTAIHPRHGKGFYFRLGEKGLASYFSTD